MAERRLGIMQFKGAKFSKILGGNLQFQTPDMCHEGSYTLRTHQYQGTAAQNIITQETCQH
jgi:carboxylesterase type B